MDASLTYLVLDDEALVVLCRPLDGLTAPSAYVALEAAIAAGARRIVVDLTVAPMLDAGGVAVLAAAISSLGPRDGRLVIALPGGRADEFSDAEALLAALGT